ncbi:polyadenylate-binding protein [Nematocida minor]|uniref:polyadenylate-binding protein n=1 Tax=Nematocida minor TaxID=1912983 RepID=UPI0022207CDA|nr:polyadenylate-binding protein [Nematocida minor]KAI5191612.1 polyadenylate-binding protein [Nematocida minor]
MNIEDAQKEKKEGQIGRHNSIYVGDLPTTVNESELYQMFSKVGQVYTIIIPRKEASVVKNKCYAYVTFFDESSVPLAIESFNFYDFNGTEIRVMPLDKESVSGNREGNIVIKNLPKETDNQTLYDTFIIFGNIVSCKVQKNSLGECSGIGYIQYKDPKVAELAINMINKITLQGKKLAAIQCIPNDQREKKKEDIEKIFTNVYVKNFPKETAEEEIREVLQQYGELTSFLAPQTDSGELKGYVFANYKTHEMAEEAIKNLHDKPFPSLSRAESKKSGKESRIDLKSIGDAVDATASGEISGEGKESAHIPKLYVQRAKPKNERVVEMTEQFAHSSQDQGAYRRNVYVTNLPGTVDEKEVIKHFEQFGKIVTHKIGTDVKNNRSYAYICYEEAEKAAKAVEQSGKTEFGGQVLDVTFFKSKKTREMEKVAINMYNNAYSSAAGAGKGKKKAAAAPQDNANATGYELYTLILSLAPNYTEKIALAGFRNEEEFAKKITGMILELEAEEVKRAAVLGNVLSNYVEESLEEIISHRKKEDNTEEAVAIE